MRGTGRRRAAAEAAACGMLQVPAARTNASVTVLSVDALRHPGCGAGSGGGKRGGFYGLGGEEGPGGFYGLEAVEAAAVEGGVYTNEDEHRAIAATMDRAMYPDADAGEAGRGWHILPAMSSNTS